MYYTALPNRRKSSHRSFTTVYRHIAETWTLVPQTMDRGRQRSVRTPDQEEYILQAEGDDPGIITFKVAKACRTFYSATWRVYQDQHLYPYPLYIRINVYGVFDHSLRKNITNALLHNMPIRCMSIQSFFTDKATFSSGRMTNLSTNIFGADRNRHVTVQVGHKHHLSYEDIF